MALQDSPLYKLIQRGTDASFAKALEVADSMSEESIRLRSEEERETYLHCIVNRATEIYKRYGHVTAAIPLIYKLALKGINVNAQNSHGNTCLHLSCIRPNADSLSPHLIRIGVDPCIQNKKQCRVIHTYRRHRCIIVKGQSTAKSGLWNAVEKEDLPTVEKLMKSWCRVSIKKNKSLIEVAEEIGNMHITRLLKKYEKTNELVCASFACDVKRVRERFKDMFGIMYLDQKDEAEDVPKPLIVAIKELGDISKKVVEELEAGGAKAGDYYDIMGNMDGAFEGSEFHRMIEEGSEDSLQRALELLATGRVDINLTSSKPETRGWTYLHYVVDKYVHIKEECEERARILIRVIYRLALAGIDVNVRDANGDTALIRASANLDQDLMTHVIRIGGDPSLAATDGRAVNEQVYEDKGKLVFDKKYRTDDWPGLWVAIESNDVKKARRCVKSWSRINTKKGDRRMIDMAHALKRQEIVRILEEYEHMNEFVCATFACDMKAMMNLLALGKGCNKVNTMDDFFHVGYTWDRHAEFMPRPIIIAAMEVCDAQVVDLLVNFGADLSKVYEVCFLKVAHQYRDAIRASHLVAESAPCGPTAFWAFRDHVCNTNALVVAKYADIHLRDELGCTMLHAAIKKKRAQGKQEVIQILLERGVNVAARDFEGSTARDYITIYGVENGEELRQMIDNHVLVLVANEQHYQIETMLLESYDHITDIRGSKRSKNALEIAHLKEYKEIIHLLNDLDKYKAEIDLLHEAARKGDLITISKLAGEKRCGWSHDKAGRSLLHNAVLYEHPDVVRFLVEQFPNLINTTDNLMRTPLHYCVCLKRSRRSIWPTLQDGEADPKLVDANNMSVYDYVREMDSKTSLKDRPRGRRWKAYNPEEVIEYERNMDYGSKAIRFELADKLKHAVKDESLAEIRTITANFQGSLALDELDIPLLKMCVENQREEVAKHLISKCGARADIKWEINSELVSLQSQAEKANMSQLVDLIKEKLSEEQTCVDQENSSNAGITGGINEH